MFEQGCSGGPSRSPQPSEKGFPPTPTLPALNVLKNRPPKRKEETVAAKFQRSAVMSSYPETPGERERARQRRAGQGGWTGKAGGWNRGQIHPQMPWGACSVDMSVKHTRKRERSGREQPTRDSPGRRNRDSGGSGPRRTAEVYTRRRASHRSRNSRPESRLAWDSETRPSEGNGGKGGRQGSVSERERIGFGKELNVRFSRELEKKTVQARMARSGNWESFGLASQRGQRGRVQ